jgi:hypothetical protein
VQDPGGLTYINLRYQGNGKTAIEDRMRSGDTPEIEKDIPQRGDRREDKDLLERKLLELERYVLFDHL